MASMGKQINVMSLMGLTFLDGYQSNNTLQRGAIFIWRLMAVITYIPYDIVGGCDLSYLGLFCFSSLVLLVGMVSYLEGKTSVVIYSRIRSDSPSLQSYPAFTCVPLYAALRAG